MKGEELHKKAENAREEGKFLEGLKLCDEATIEYGKEGNVIKLAEVQATRALTLRHIWEQTSDKNFLILAKFAAKSGVKIIEDSGSNQGIIVPLYTLAKCLEDLEKFDKAKEKIEEALSFADSGSNKAMVAEMKTRLDAIKYRLGDNAGLESFTADIADLEEANYDDDYTKNVWVSGAYMHMAKALISKGDKEKASELLKKAHTIVESNARLSIRANQLEKLDNLLN